MDMICQMIPKGGVVFDVGANYGQFTASAAKIVGKKGKVYCFEPLSYPLMVLKHMVFLRNFKQVVIKKTAISDHAGTAVIATPLEKGWKPKHALSYLSDTNEDKAVFEEVSLRTLDEFCHSEKIDRIDFIKCDVEGSEFNVFSGAKGVLSKFKPLIYCEIEKPYCERRNIKVSAIFELLGEFGYRSYLPDSSCSLIPVDGYTRKANYFFIHSPHSRKLS